MKEIKLTQNKVALVDDADFSWLNSVKWTTHRVGKNEKNFYAHRQIRRQDGSAHCVSMHQLLSAVMGFSKPDHKDGNGLNNQRLNLRPATQGQNCMNRGMRSDNTSGFKGVSWRKGTNKWRAYINLQGVREWLGYFDFVEEAARAYDKRAKELFGEFAKLNFPETKQTTN